MPTRTIKSLALTALAILSLSIGSGIGAFAAVSWYVDYATAYPVSDSDDTYNADGGDYNV